MHCADSTIVVLISMMLLLPYAILAPVLPLAMKDRHIDQILTGVVFSTFSLGWLLVPSLVTKYMLGRCGRRGTTQIGSLLLSASILFYGLEFYIEAKGLFVFLMVITRLLEGIGATMALTAFVALLPKIFPDQRGKAFSARYCGTTFGSSVGILIASVAFQLSDVMGMFAVISFICFLAVFLNFFFAQNKDHPPKKQLQPFNPISSGRICCIKRTFLALMNNAISDALFLFIQPILALKLTLQFHYSQSSIALFLFCYLIFVVLATFISLSLPAKVEKRGVIIIGDAFMTIALIFIGPSKLFHIPNEPALMILGLCLGGFGQGLATGFMLQQAFKGAMQKYPERDLFISDRISSIYTTLYGFCTLTIPMLASFLNEHVGFEHTIDFLMIVTLINFLIFMISTVGDLRRESKRPRILRMQSDEEEEEEDLLS